MQSGSIRSAEPTATVKSQPQATEQQSVAAAADVDVVDLTASESVAAVEKGDDVRDASASAASSHTVASDGLAYQTSGGKDDKRSTSEAPMSQQIQIPKELYSYCRHPSSKQDLPDSMPS